MDLMVQIVKYLLIVLASIYFVKDCMGFVNAVNFVNSDKSKINVGFQAIGIDEEKAKTLIKMKMNELERQARADIMKCGVEMTLKIALIVFCFKCL